MQLRNLMNGRSPANPGAVLGIATALLLCSVPAFADETWILIDTGEGTLSIMQGEKAVRQFDNISIGRNGATARKLRNDNKTPTGAYRISRINNDSPYHRFIGIDYPGLQYARRALEDGVINAEEYAAIRQAHEKGLEPPASTPLGGFIGIHGIGDGDSRFHEDFNWTQGCVALTNEEVDELLRSVRLDMVVVIL